MCIKPQAPPFSTHYTKPWKNLLAEPREAWAGQVPKGREMGVGMGMDAGGQKHRFLQHRGIAPPPKAGTCQGYVPLARDNA